MVRFHVERTTQIAASPQQVFETVADFGTWTTWSPWLCSEPDADVRISDDPKSVGSLYSWKGELVGAGEIEHKRLEPGRKVEEEIRFLKPFRSTSQVWFDIEPNGEGAKLTWHMNGSLPWFMFWMRSMMEPFIGMDYERGLRMLKEWIETGQVLSQTKIRGVESVGPLRAAGARRKCTMRELGPSMEGAFAEATEKLSKHGLPSAGQPISIYHHFDMKAQVFDYTSGFVLAESASLPTDMSTWSLPKANALCVEHIGSYAHLGNAWSAANQYARYKKLKQSKVGAYEIYMNDPEDTQPADLRTVIYLPLR